MSKLMYRTMISRALEGKRRQQQQWQKTSPAPPRVKQEYSINKSYTQSIYSFHYSDEEEDGWSDIPLTFCGGGSNLGLKEVMRSSVEVLGMSSLGITGKVILLDGSTFTVKRFRKVKVGRIDFGKRVERVSAICSQCEYLVPIRAYLYAKRIKLVMCNYYPIGSLASLLAGARNRGHTPLNWQTRARIILHAARAMAFIHSQPPSTDEKRFRSNVHGNIKPSNIFITTDFSARLSDYGFSQLARPIDVLNAAPPRKPLPTTLQAKIVTKRSSRKEDVFDFGVMVLEVLGGASAPYKTHCIVERMEEIRVGSCHFFEYFVEGEVKDEACRVLEVAIACMDSVAEARPSAGDILASLTDTLSISLSCG